ncbi:MAG: M42 family metallopeptidase [Gemmatimonadales bacterium]
MRAESIAFLKALLDTPGPSGFETAPARLWRKQAETFADSVNIDVGGNSVAALRPDSDVRVMFAGHIDEIGFMITHVDDQGFLYFSTIGGWDHQVFVGQRVEIMTERSTIIGVIGKKAVHLIKSEDRDSASTTKDLWIDIGARNRAGAKKKVRIGDAGVISSESIDFPRRRVVSRSIDNRIGAFVVLEALRLLKRRKLSAGVFAVATAREEISWTGGGARTSASGIDPTVAIVVDVTHATDHPTVEQKEHGDIKLGEGPVLTRGSVVNPVVFDLLVSAAKSGGIPYQLSAAPVDTGTDADNIHSALRGIPTGLVSIPNRYMHSPNEMIDLGDVDKAARLLAEFARKVGAKSDFRPA